LGVCWVRATGTGNVRLARRKRLKTVSEAEKSGVGGDRAFDVGRWDVDGGWEG